MPLRHARQSAAHRNHGLRVCRVQARLKVSNETFERWQWGVRASSTSHVRQVEDSDESIAAVVEREALRSTLATKRPLVCIVHESAPQTLRRAPAAFSAPEAQIKLL